MKLTVSKPEVTAAIMVLLFVGGVATVINWPLARSASPITKAPVSSSSSVDRSVEKRNEPVVYAEFPPSDNDFGNTIIGADSIQVFDYNNGSSAPLTIRKVAVIDDRYEAFLLKNQCPYALAAWQGCRLEVAFRPTRIGRHNARLVMDKDDVRGHFDNVVLAHLSGTGIERVIQPSRLAGSAPGIEAVEQPILFADFYAKSEAGSLKPCARYRMNAYIDVEQGSFIPVRPPEWPNKIDGRWLAAVPQFDEPSQFEALLRSVTKGVKSIAVSNCEGNVYIHRVDAR